MADLFSQRSNIFGEITSSSGVPDIPYSSSEATQAGQLIDKLKNIADNEIQDVAAAVEWLGLAANQGQNGTGDTLVGYQNIKPKDLDANSAIISGWKAPDLPTMPALPALPDDLKIDLGTFKTDVKQLVDDLKASWMHDYLPDPSDVSAFESMTSYILGGSASATVTQTVNIVYADLVSSLESFKSSAMIDVVQQIADLKSTLASNISAIQPKIDATTTETQDTSDIIFARGRDQVARESARLEAEAAAEWASSGWSMPGGPLAAQQAMARQATLDAASKFAADEAARVQLMNVDLAKTAITSWLQTTDMTLRSNLDSMRAYLDARLRYSTLDLEAQRAKADDALKGLGLQIDMSKFAGDVAVRYRLGVIQSMNQLVEAYAALNRNEMEYYAAIANAKRANLLALVEYYRAGLSYAEMGMKVSETNIDTQLKWAEIAGAFIANSVRNHVQAASATGDLYARIAGMALSGLNGVASVATSG